MKINPTIKLTLLLLVIMSGVGTASAYLAYNVGYKALQGVNQPPTNPAKKLKKTANLSTKPTEFVPVNEKTILIKVYDHIHQEEKSNSKSSKKKSKNDDKKAKKTSQSDSESVSITNLPIRVQDSGVTLEVTNASKKAGNLLLNVNLRNEGDNEFKFLYSFLEVKDNQGRSLSAITEGLPDELPPNKERFNGTIKIPTALMSQVESISLNLTDYPDQKLELKLSKIPVVR
ncbi:MAG TPA: hypothetical protein DCF68_19045 [Cyanothece sp. UBA12306]|nr:hypothetical protein [Cyanothece sp. UBA12306]